MVDAIMGFHGEVHGMIPQEVYNNRFIAFDAIKKHKKNNRTLTCETNSGRGGIWGSYYINIEVDKNKIRDVINDVFIVN